MSKEDRETKLRVLNNLATLLKVKLNDSKLAVTSPSEVAKAVMHDNSLEAILLPNFARPAVRIQSPRAPGIYIELVDHNKDLAPPGAIYRIEAYNYQSGGDCTTITSGEVNAIYIGKEGIILPK